jgi:hypothetical protein
MSRTIITDLVLPVVVRELNKKGANIPSYADIQDNQLLEYLEQELMINFSICGSKDHCKDLEKAIKEARSLSEEEFTAYIQRILNRYINMKIAISGAQKVDAKKITAEQAIKMVIGEDGKQSPEWREFPMNDRSPMPNRFDNLNKTDQFRKRKRNLFDEWLPEES